MTTTLQQFLKSYYHTVATSELENHLDLYSRKVQLYGVPGREVLHYHDIARRRYNEFTRGLLLRVVFGAPEILEETEGSLTYRVHETMKGTNGLALAYDSQVKLVHEPDGQWRIREQHITNARMFALKTGEAPK